MIHRASDLDHLWLPVERMGFIKGGEFLNWMSNY